MLIPKHQRRLRGLDEKILTLYARGLSTRDIALQLEDLYGAQVSVSLISEVTDTVSEDVKAWQNCPLDELYPIVYLDALYVNIKVGGRVSKRAVYVVLGINRDGTKDVLGLWIGEAEAALEAFAEKWDETYPVISQIWLRHWDNIIPIFDYPMDIRWVIYTTNAIESLNRSLRKLIKTKAVFPDEASVFKLMYLALSNISKRWTRPIKN